MNPLYKIFKSKKKNLFVLMIIFALPFYARALMQGNNYMIYETVLQNFDGPVITGVVATAQENEATVAWSTDVAANGYVIYSTDSGLTNSSEQGSATKNGTSQSVTLVGLSAATTYYYRVRSASLREWGGTTTDSTIRTFTTAATTPVVTPTPSDSGGGGVIIIDKTDKIAPNILNVRVVNINSDSATILWETDEDAISFVEYGKSATFGNTYGQWDSTKNHEVTLNFLEEQTTYFFRALSADSSGNLAISPVQTFTTLSFAEQIEKEKETPPVPPTGEEPSLTLEIALDKIAQMFRDLVGKVSVGTLEESITKHFDALDFLNEFLPGPIFLTEPKVEADAREVKIEWATNIEASSQVAYAPEDNYRPESAEPYIQVIGNIEIKTKNHVVEIVGLEPNTTYHYQIISQAKTGPTSKSQDFTFKTKEENLGITSYSIKIISTEEALFRWITSFETDTSLTHTPWRGNALAPEEAETKSDKSYSLIHEIDIDNFEGGVVYQIELSGRDVNNRVVNKTISNFSTSKVNLAPIISSVRTDSVITPGNEDKIQVIVSWNTNETTNSRVYYQKGIGSIEGDLTEKTPLDTNYTKKHVIVLARLEAGQVYSFRVESADSDGNTARSQLYSILTPKKKESIFDIILRILEETFGWIGKLRGGN